MSRLDDRNQLSSARAREYRVPMSEAGLSLVEVLLVIAVLAILLTIGFAAIRPNNARALAMEISQLNQQARYESINRSQMILASWDPDTARFQLSLATSVTCTPDGAVLRSTTEYADVAANTRQFAGVIWRPNGLAISCSTAAPLAGQRLTLSSQRHQSNIQFDVGGRAEMR